MQLPLHEARGDLASVELLEEMCSTPGCSCTAPGLWGLAGPWHGFAQSTVRSRQDRAVHAWSTLHPAARTPRPHILLNQASCPGWLGLGHFRGEASAVPLVPLTSAADLA